MAKRRNSSYSSAKRGSLYSNANRRLLSPVYRLPQLSPLSLLEDRRFFHPLREFKPAATLGSLRARTLKPAVSRSNMMRFAIPKKVAVCVRRNVRREVILALGKSGAGARAPKHRSAYSSVSCKE